MPCRCTLQGSGTARWEASRREHIMKGLAYHGAADSHCLDCRADCGILLRAAHGLWALVNQRLCRSTQLVASKASLKDSVA